MTKLMDVRCYYKNFDGKLLLEENGWFEGVIKDKMKRENLVFGVYQPEKAIEFIELPLIKEKFPTVYKGKIDDKDYKNCYFATSISGSVPNFMSYLTIRDVEYLKTKDHLEVRKRNIDAEKNDLLLKIASLKEKSYCMNLYYNIFSMREKISKMVLDSYLSATSSQELPVISDKTSKTSADAKRLVKSI